MVAYKKIVYVQNADKNYTYSGSGQVEMPDNALNCAKKLFPNKMIPFDHKEAFALQEESWKKDTTKVVEALKGTEKSTMLLYYAGQQQADMQEGLTEGVISYGRLDEYNTSKEDYEKSVFPVYMAEFAKKGLIPDNGEKIAVYMQAELWDSNVDIWRFDGKSLVNIRLMFKHLFDRHKFKSNRKPLGMKLGDYHRVCDKGISRDVLDVFSIYGAEVIILNQEAMPCPHCGKGTIYLEKNITTNKDVKQKMSYNQYLDTVYAHCDACGAELTRGDFVQARTLVEKILEPQAYENMFKKLQKDAEPDKTEEGFARRKHLELSVPTVPTKKAEMPEAGPVVPGDLNVEALPETYEDPHKYVDHASVTGRSDLFREPVVRKSWEQERAEYAASIAAYNAALIKRVTPEIFTESQTLFDFIPGYVDSDGKYKRLANRTRFLFLSK